MRDFLCGWQRKAGCAALIMACLLMGMWARSRVIDDKVFMHGRSGQQYSLSSVSGALEWYCWSGSVPRPFFWRTFQGLPWYSSPNTRPVIFQRNGLLPFLIEEKVDCGPDMSRLESEGKWGANIIVTGNGIRIAYILLVIPLTLFSALLILWKPRKRRV